MVRLLTRFSKNLRRLQSVGRHSLRSSSLKPKSPVEGSSRTPGAAAEFQDRCVACSVRDLHWRRRYIQRDYSENALPERGVGPSVRHGALYSGGRESNACGGTVARRTNYGFEKKQREARKQQKKKEKAERRAAEEAAALEAERGAAGDETPPESGPPDSD